MEEKEESFLAKMTVGGRITIKDEVRKKLGLTDGDMVRVTVRKEDA